MAEYKRIYPELSAKEATVDETPTDEHFDALAKLLGLDKPLGPVRLGCLKAMHTCAYTGKPAAQMNVFWPRGPGLKWPDYCKTSTIQVFLLHHMTGTSNKDVIVFSATARQAKITSQDLAKAAKCAVDVKITRFNDEEIRYLVNGKEVKILFKPFRAKDTKAFTAPISICDDAGFCSKEVYKHCTMTFETDDGSSTSPAC